MKFVKDLYQNLKKRYYKRKCYTSVEDLPIQTWFKIHETQDLTLLFKGYNSRFINLPSVWKLIYDEYIKRIGLNGEYLDYLNTLKKIAVLECECTIAPEPIKKTLLNIEREKLKEKTTKTGSNYNEIIAQVSKMQGYPLWKVSVLEFYSYIKINGK
jgi:hypothetical protein